MRAPLTIADAHAITTRWVNENPHLHEAAFIGGSAATARPNQPYDPASDIDCYLVINEQAHSDKIGKILVEGVLLDVSWMPWTEINSAQSNAVTASLLNFGQVISDSSGHLTAVQREIRDSFTRPAAINLRMDDMRQRIRSGLTGDSSHLPEPERLMNWLFPATLATHIPLVAACAPLTVRKRFVAARQVMNPADYEDLLDLYGFADVTPAQTEQWLALTDHIFSENQPLAESSTRFWAGDIRADARPIAIGGSQQLIDTGLHREALYWILAICARCLVVREDAGAPPSRFKREYDAMLTELSLVTANQRSSKSASILNWIDASFFN